MRDLRPGDQFIPDHLYIDDSGRVYCGAHVGVEATYMAQAWSDLGRVREYTHGGVTFRCEDPRCGRYSR